MGGVADSCGGYGGFGVNAASVLVLYILLVIILSTGFFI